MNIRPYLLSGPSCLTTDKSRLYLLKGCNSLNMLDSRNKCKVVKVGKVSIKGDW